MSEHKKIFADPCIRVHELIGERVIVTIRTLGDYSEVFRDTTYTAEIIDAAKTKEYNPVYVYLRRESQGAPDEVIMKAWRLDTLRII